ncbi:MAG: HEAT repeat domain-containing protein [Anaerolineae bacterium]
MYRYKNLDIKLRGNAVSGYVVEVSGPRGESARGSFQLPASVMSALQSDTWPRPPTDRTSIEALGSDLFQALFPMDVMTCFGSVRSRLHHDVGLRLRLHLPSELAYLPWELLYYRPSYLSLDPRCLLVRFIDMGDRPQIMTVRPPLRLLHLASNAVDRDAPQFDQEKELFSRALRDLMAEEQMEVVTTAATMANLQGRLREGYHILHYSGPVTLRNGIGYLIFSEAGGEQQWIDSHTLLQFLGNSGVRLAVLNAHQSDQLSDLKALLSLALALVRGGLLAVVVTQLDPTGSGTLTFFSRFYRALRQSSPVDLAMVEGRKGIIKELGANWHDAIDWSIPMLYMRSPDGMILPLEQEAAPVERLPAAVPSRPPAIAPLTRFLTPLIAPWMNWQYRRALRQALEARSLTESELMVELPTLLPTGRTVTLEGRDLKLLQALRQHDKLIILGEPGAGKTTSLRHLCLHTLQESGSKLPLFASLDTYRGGDLLPFLRDILAQYGGHRIASKLEDHLEQGRLALFLDALNEMPGRRFQQNVARLQDFMDRYPHNNFILACRTAHYNGELGLLQATIRPLDDQTVQRYVERHLRQGGRALFQSLRDGGAIDMVRNPLLLSMVVRTGRVPHSQGNLIGEYVDLLARKEKGPVPANAPPGFSWIRSVEGRRALEVLAYTMMQREHTTVINLEEACHIVREQTRAQDPMNLLTQAVDVGLMAFADGRQRTLRFHHQLLQEQFAARELQRRWPGFEPRNWDEVVHDPWWWEPIVLLAGLLGEKRSELIAHILNTVESDESLFLSLACLAADVRGLGEEAKQQVTDRLVDFLGRWDFGPTAGSSAVELARLGGKRVTDFLAGLFEIEDEAVTRQVVAILGQIGGPHAADQLVQKGLPILDQTVLSITTSSLTQIGKEAVEPLVNALQSEQPEVWERAATILAQSGEDAVEALIESLHHGDEAVSRRATEVLVQIGEPAVKPLVAALRNSDRDVRDPQSNDVRWRVAEALGRIGHPQAVEALVGALHDSDWHIRDRAALALGNIRDPHALEPLVRALRDADWRVRDRAAAALGKMGDARAVAPLIQALHDDDEDVRLRVTAVLGKIGDAQAVQPLIEALHDTDWRVRQEAANVLAKIGREAMEPLIGALCSEDKDVAWRAAKALRQTGEMAVEPLMAALHSADWAARDKALRVLVQIGEDAVEPLIEALTDEDADVRWRVAEALGTIGDQRATEPLIRALQDDDGAVRREAIEALGKIGGSRVAEPLIEALGDSDGTVRWRAAGMLGKIGDTRAVQPLIKALHDDDRDVRWRAAWALGKIGDPQAVKPLIGTLRDDDADVRWRAVWALGKLEAPRAVRPLIRLLRDDDAEVRREAAEALGKIGDSKAIEPLLKALHDYHGDVRREAVGALGKIGDEGAVEPLINALHDYDGDMRWEAAEALGKIGDARAVKPLIRALSDNDNGVRREAAKALGKIGHSRAVKPLIRSLGEDDVILRREAAEALGKIGDPRAVEPLISALQDDDWRVRDKAAEALKQIKT